MREVIPGLLWIGHAGDARNPRRLAETGIAAVVDLALEERPPEPARETILCRFPLIDGDGNPAETIVAAVETVASLIRGRIPTLVCCSGGMSRSPAIAAAALSRVRGETPDECLKRITKTGPQDVSGGLWASVRSALGAGDRNSSVESESIARRRSAGTSPPG